METWRFTLNAGQVKEVEKAVKTFSVDEWHNVFCKDDFGRFKVTFKIDKNLKRISVEKPRLVLYFKSDEGEDVYLEIKSQTGTFKRAFLGLMSYFWALEKPVGE